MTTGLDRETEPYALLDTLPRPEFKRLATLAHASTLPRCSWLNCLKVDPGNH